MSYLSKIRKMKKQISVLKAEIIIANRQDAILKNVIDLQIEKTNLLQEELKIEKLKLEFSEKLYQESKKNNIHYADTNSYYVTKIKSLTEKLESYEKEKNQAAETSI